MGDILDSMNALAEKEDDRNMDVIADIIPPPPPEPPPNRISCSGCGYTAPEPEFKKNHPHCPTEMFLKGFFLAIGVVVVGVIAISLFMRFI